MDIYWGKNKNKKPKLEEEEVEEKKEEKKDIMPPLEYTKLYMSNIAVDNNHIYFYSEVSRLRMLELNRALTKANIDMQKKQLDLGLETPPPIYLHIHSYGGSVLSCFTTIDTILGLDCKTVSIIEGAAASAATLVSVVCNERRITPHSYMLIHQLSSGFWGKMEEIKDEYHNLQQFMKEIKAIYKEYTRVPVKKLDDILSHDIWFPAKKCLEYKLVDTIITSKKRSIEMI